MSLKKYDTTINGFKTTVLLSDEDAKRAGFNPSDGRDRFADSVASDVSPRPSEAEKTSLRDEHLAEAADKAEQERLTAEKVEADRIAAEKTAADKAEAERLEAEKAAAASAEKAKTPANKARTPRGKNA